MIKYLRFPLSIIAMIFMSAQVQGQPDKFAYTVTDSIQQGIRWNYLRTIDMRNGTFSNILLRLLNRNDTVPHPSLCNGVAAIALDEKNKKLYYTPMLIDRLSYIDLKTMKTHIVTNNFTGLVPKAADQSNIITRMVIGDDDFGYAITNDGNHLIRFNTRNNQVKNLGALIDAPSNNGVSVHEVCSSFGGDIVAGDDEYLYLITSRNYVFRINTKTRIAKYMGSVSGLPENYTTSGVAVDFRKNKILIASSTDVTDVYTVNINSLVAEALGSDNPWLSSDLASSNRLKKKKDDDDDDFSPEFIFSTNPLYAYKIKLYPNPVTTNEFKIQFADMELGNYRLIVLDALGQVILSNNFIVSTKINNTSVNLPELTAKGIYIVRISDKNNKVVFSEKITVQ